jgi:hypothetical protein
MRTLNHYLDIYYSLTIMTNECRSGCFSINSCFRSMSHAHQAHTQLKLLLTEKGRAASSGARLSAMKCNT